LNSIKIGGTESNDFAAEHEDIIWQCRAADSTMNVETESFNIWTVFDFAVTVEGVSVKRARVEF
jgi:hypothetical protein